LHNESPAKNWLDVQVVGKEMKRMGIGAQVELYRAGQSGKAEALLGFREMSIGYGYASGQAAVCHFGLGELPEVDVVVTLPAGAVIRREGVKANRKLVIEEP